MVQFGLDQLFDPVEGMATVEDVAICSIIPMTHCLLILCTFPLSLFQFVMQCCPCTSGWCIILAHVRRWMASNSQYNTAPSVFPAKKHRQLCLKQSSNEPSSENFLTIGGCFECYMYHVTALGWLKNKEEKTKGKKKKMNNSDFRPFQVCHFKSCSVYFRHGHLFPGDDIAVETLIHWLELPSCFQVILSSLPQAHNYAFSILSDYIS